MDEEEQHIPEPLRRQWWYVTLTSVAVILACCAGLSLFWNPGAALRWLAQTALVLAVVMGFVRYSLPMNHHTPQTRLLPDLGPGTMATIIRGVFMSMLAGFLLLPWNTDAPEYAWLRWIPGILYVLAASIDYADGFLARRYKHVTKLGKRLDNQLDGLGMLIATLIGLNQGQIPTVYLLVGVIYYILQPATWLRRRLGKPVYPLQANMGMRMLVGFQMGYLGAALFPIFSPPATTLAGIIFMIPFLAVYVRDWLQMWGYISRDPGTRWTTLEERIVQVVKVYIPVGLRLLVFLLGFHLLATWSESAAIGFTYWHVLNAGAFVLLISGILGRIAALILTISHALHIMQSGMEPALMVFFSCVIILMMSGSGKYSLWQPEEHFLLKRLGSPEA